MEESNIITATQSFDDKKGTQSIVLPIEESKSRNYYGAVYSLMLSLYLITTGPITLPSDNFSKGLNSTSTVYEYRHNKKITRQKSYSFITTRGTGEEDILYTD